MMGKVKKEAVKVADSFTATLSRPIDTDKRETQKTDKPSDNSEGSAK